MRLSATVLISQGCILLLLCFAIAMEIPAWVNDFLWNFMKDNPNERPKLSDLQKCKIYEMNGSFLIPSQRDYDKIFLAKKRDLPYETYFLAISGFSFLLYFISSMIYLSWKRIMPNIYISIAVNSLGSVIHAAAFSLILTSTVIYSRENMGYMGSKACYKFTCKDCPDQDIDPEYYTRSKHLFLRTRDCLETLHVCQSGWLKDRIVFLLLFCIMASLIAFFSSLARCRRHVKKNKVRPKRFSFDSDDTVELTIHVEDGKKNSNTPDSNFNSIKTSSAS